MDADYENNTPWLHIYAQAMWHDEAVICGNRLAIEALRDALTRALDDADGVALAEAFTNDGERYFVHVHMLPFGEMERLAVPYTDGIASARDDSFWPWSLPRQPKYPQPEPPQ